MVFVPEIDSGKLAPMRLLHFGQTLLTKRQVFPESKNKGCWNLSAELNNVYYYHSTTPPPPDARRMQGDRDCQEESGRARFPDNTSTSSGKVSELDFQPFEWRTEETTWHFPAGSPLTVRCWAKTLRDETVMIKFCKNYYYELYVELPDKDDGGAPCDWTKSKRTALRQTLASRLLKDSPVHAQLASKKLLYDSSWSGFKTFFVLQFFSKSSSRACAKYLKSGIELPWGRFTFPVYETEIPVLTKFFSATGVSPTEWMITRVAAVDRSALMTDDKKCIEYVGCPASLRKLDDPPGCMARCKILSFDLEVYSSRGDKVFPKPRWQGTRYSWHPPCSKSRATLRPGRRFCLRCSTSPKASTTTRTSWDTS